VIDPVKLSEMTQKQVCKDGLRKYYRFRPAKFYGGISTADCVGCCLSRDYPFARQMHKRHPCLWAIHLRRDTQEIKELSNP
jgi:uncharacterized Fe-S cluster-containing radical SAM superfamily protein